MIQLVIDKNMNKNIGHDREKENVKRIKIYRILLFSITIYIVMLSLSAFLWNTNQKYFYFPQNSFIFIDPKFDYKQKQMLKFFEKQYEKYFRINFPLDVLSSPSKLLHLIRKKSLEKQFAKSIVRKTQNGYKILRKLTIAHLLMIQTNSFICILQEFIQNPLDSTDQWLNQNFIRPYYRFLKKIIVSQQLYTKTKLLSNHRVTFQLMFYIINLFSDMFKIVQKISVLGRYYSNEIVTNSFIDGIVIQAQRLYITLKNHLLQILSDPKKYLKSKEDQKLLKIILQESLTEINEKMKNLFLQKHFYPYGRGFQMKIFRLQDQNNKISRIINGILSDHRETQRQEAYLELQNIVFPDNGKINIQFLEKTLRLDNQKLKTQKKIEQDIEQEVIPTEFEDSQEQAQDENKKIGEMFLRDTVDDDEVFERLK